MRTVDCLLLNRLNQVRHLYSGNGGIEALIAALGAGAFDSLFECVRGNDAKDNRYAGVQAGIGDALADLGGNVIEVGSASPDYRPQADDGVIFLALAIFCAMSGISKEPRPCYFNIGFEYAVAGQRIHRALEQLAAEEFIETRHHHPELKPFPIKLPS